VSDSPAADMLGNFARRQCASYRLGNEFSGQDPLNRAGSVLARGINLQNR
jgi:hypothetical protein